MKLLLLLVSTAGYLSYFGRQPGIGFYRAPFVFCCVATLSLYATAIIGCLPIGVWITLVIGLVLAAVELIHRLRHGERYSARMVVAGIALILPFVWWYLVIETNFKFLLWDEFSFWASSAKIIFETNALFKTDSPIFLKSYPPGQQLLQYYFTKLAGWSEKNVLYAQVFWMLSGLLCIVGSFSTRAATIATTFLLSCTWLYFFEYSFSSIYSDALLGICFAACVALAVNASQSNYARLAFACGLATLILIKEIALLLMLIAWALWGCIVLVDRYSSGQLAKRSAHKIVGVSAGYLLFVMLVQRSWAWYVSTIDGTRQEAIGLADKLTAALASGRVEQTWLEFVLRVTKPQYLKMSLFDYATGPAVWLTVLLLVVLAAVAVRLGPAAERRRNVTIYVLLFAGLVAYVAVLFFSYLVFFTEYEGIRLASFERYLSTYMLAVSLITFAGGMAIFDHKSSLIRSGYQLAVAAVVLLLAPTVFYTELKSIQAVGPAVTMRRDTEAFAGQVKRHIKAGEKVYFVAQNSNGLERTMFYYAMLPYSTSTGWCWSFGKKYYEGDVWTCDKNLAELTQGYEYLALYYADAQFWQLAGDLFEPSARGVSHGVFKINRGGSTQALFTQLK